jgi:hypothetical protein
MAVKQLSGAELQTYLREKAQELRDNAAQAEELMANSKRIEDEIFKPLNLDPNTLLKGNSGTAKAKRKNNNGHERAGKGELREAILDLIDKNKGQITSHEAAEMFARKDFQTSAYVVLSRMEKTGVLKSEKGDGRGSIWRRKET